MHHLRRVRVPVSGGHRTRSHDRRLKAWRGEYRQVGRPLRDQAVPGAGTQRQRAGIHRERARQVRRQGTLADFRRLTGVLSVAGLHGRVRSAGPGNHRVVCARDGTPGNVLWCAAQGTLHRRSGTQAGQRPAVRSTGGDEFGWIKTGQGVEDRLHLPALRADDFGGLAQRELLRSSITASFWRGIAIVCRSLWSVRRSCITIRAISAGTEACMRSLAWWSKPRVRLSRLRARMSAASVAGPAGAWPFWEKKQASA